MPLTTYQTLFNHLKIKDKWFEGPCPLVDHMVQSPLCWTWRKNLASRTEEIKSILMCSLFVLCLCLLFIIAATAWRANNFSRVQASLRSDHRSFIATVLRPYFDLFCRLFVGCRKCGPNVVIASLLWRISKGIWANQNQKYFKWIIFIVMFVRRWDSAVLSSFCWIRKCVPNLVIAS